MIKYFGEDLKTYEVVVSPSQLLGKPVYFQTDVTDDGISLMLARLLQKEVPNLEIITTSEEYNAFIDAHPIAEGEVYCVTAIKYMQLKEAHIACVDCTVALQK